MQLCSHTTYSMQFCSLTSASRLLPVVCKSLAGEVAVHVQAVLQRTSNQMPCRESSVQPLSFAAQYRCCIFLYGADSSVVHPVLYTLWYTPCVLQHGSSNHFWGMKATFAVVMCRCRQHLRQCTDRRSCTQASAKPQDRPRCTLANGSTRPETRGHQPNRA